MTDDGVDWTSLEFDITASSEVAEMLDEMRRRIVASIGFDPVENRDAIEALLTAGREIAKAFGAALAPIIDAMAQLWKSCEPTIIAIADLMAELDEAIASRRPARQSHTLNRRAQYAPPRDLRATEAPRRPPTLHRRPRP